MIFFQLVTFIFGLLIGSFLNVVIFRLEKGEHFGGSSYCPHCKHTLSWLDLVPVFSYIFLLGKCRSCKGKISIQYPIVEISTALIFLLIYNLKFEIYNQFEIFQFSNVIGLLFLFYIASVLIVIFAYDLKHYIIPDKILFPAIVIAFLYRLFENFNILVLNSNFKFQISNFFHVGNYMLAPIIASGFFLAIFLISKGRWMGFGDVKLAVLLGLLLGLPNILVGLFLAFLLGAIIGVISIIFAGKGLKSQMPFAPFLISGTFIALFLGEKIIEWHSNLFIL